MHEISFPLYETCPRDTSGLISVVTNIDNSILTPGMLVMEYVYKLWIYVYSNNFHAYIFLET